MLVFKSPEFRNLKGIYVIKNVVSDKFYLGSTKATFNKRFLSHKNDLAGNRHSNKYLQIDYNFQNGKDFVFTPILVLEDSEILCSEQRFLNKFFDSVGCYNLNKMSCPCCGCFYWFSSLETLLLYNGTIFYTYTFKESKHIIDALSLPAGFDAVALYKNLISNLVVNENRWTSFGLLKNQTHLKNLIS